jgi:hypothetical protein
MQDLEKSLSELSKITPSGGFIRKSKTRLLHRIELHENEFRFKSLLARVGIISPSEAFLTQARMRLMERIQIPRPSWAWIIFAKRFAASTLVMTLAVTCTLFFIGGHQTVNASEDTYIEILAGSATVKHADRLIWDEITSQTELAEGDLIKMGKGSEAIIRFFDDSQLRLAENSLLLISKIAVSPAYARQGIIEVSLHEGNAWVQTLNVDDGYAGFTLITRDAIAKVINSTFDVKTGFDSPTVFSVLQNKIELTTLQPDTREAVGSLKVSADNQIKITSGFNSTQKPSVAINPLTSQEKTDKWIERNLQMDRDHLAQLREKELSRLRETVSVLPGNMLYPFKQGLERLKLALSFNEPSVENMQIEIANERLNEAILLLQNGDRQKAMESLMAYQSIARQIAEEVQKNQKSRADVAHRLITPYQKTLIASLPAAPVGIVKEALNQTEELFTNDPIQREKIRLENSVDRLHDVIAFLEAGDLDSAKDSLVNNELIATTILDEAKNIQDAEGKKELLNSILEMRNEELALLNGITNDKASLEERDPRLASMLKDAQEQAQKEVINTIAFIRPLVPELVLEHKQQQAIDGRVQYFVDKIGIYKTWQGQKNQIDRLLKEDSINANNIPFLLKLKGNSDTRMQDYINSKILELESKDRYLKHKIVSHKIDRAMRERDN